MSYLLNQNIFTIIQNMSSIVLGYTGKFMSLSLGIASILIMFVIAQESYKLMLGKPFDVMWWIRPLLMLMIILTWQSTPSRSSYIQTSLPGIIRSMFGGLEGSAKTTFMTRMARLEERKKKKLELLDQKWTELSNKGAEAATAKDMLENADKEEKDSGVTLNPSTWTDAISKKFDSIKESMVVYSKMIVLYFSHWTDKVLEWVGNFIWAVSIYATFMAQSLGIAFLTIFGPLHFGLSVYDLWKDAWASWLMRFISFQFYGFVAYIVMTASCSLIDFGVQADIALLSQPGFPEAFSFNAIFTLFGYFIGAAAMKMVPEIVSWIVPTNSSQAMGQFSQGISSTFGTAPAKFAVNSAVSLTGAAIGGTVGAFATGAWDRTGKKVLNQSMDKLFGKPYSSNTGGSSSRPSSSSSPPPSSGGSSGGGNKSNSSTSKPPSGSSSK